MEHLRIVFDILKANKLRVKLEKCRFGKEEVQYLGHIISEQGVAIDPSKIEAMMSWPKPSTCKALRGFLGLTDSFQWSPASEEAFQKLKIAMTQAPVLSLLDFSKTFIVECDASGHGVGAILLQERPISYFNQVLRGKHLLLSTYEKEILPLALAIQKWRPYLLGKQFMVRTDHQSLKHLWSQKIVTTAQQKWLYKFMGYDFKVEYKKGKENVVADALSRSHEQPQGVVFAISQLLPRWLEVIQEEVAVKPILQDLQKKIQQGEALEPWKLNNDTIFFKDRIYLLEDSELVKAIIKEFHGSTHESYVKTLQRIKENFC